MKETTPSNILIPDLRDIQFFFSKIRNVGKKRRTQIQKTCICIQQNRTQLTIRKERTRGVTAP